MKRALIAIAFMGCSSSESSGPTTSEDGAITTDSIAIVDGESPFDGAVEDTAKTYAGYGSVTLLAIHSGTYQGTTATAGFQAASTAGTPSACTQTAVGSCTFLHCAISGGTPPAPTPKSAGDVRLSGGLPAEGLVLSYGGSSYAAVTRMMKLLSPGDAISLSAAGADVSAFAGKVLKMPGEVVTTSPSCAAGNCGEIDRSEDLSVAWSGGSEGDAYVYVSSYVAGVASDTVTCSAPVSSGRLTIPKDALGKLRADGTASFSALPRATSTFDVGDWSVSFYLQNQGSSGTAKLK